MFLRKARFASGTIHNSFFSTSRRRGRALLTLGSQWRIPNQEVNSSRFSNVMAKDQVFPAHGYVCENHDSEEESLQDAIQATAEAFEALVWLRFMLRFYRPLEGKIDFFGMVRDFEICLIKRALHHAAGQQTKAAAWLNLKPTTLNEKLKSYGLILEAKKIKRGTASRD